MIDIHSHILWEQDDGSRSFEESVAMVHMAAASGTTDIVATPHANPEYDFDPEAVERKIAQLQAAVGDAIRIHYGCDFHLMVENIEGALEDPGRYSIAHRGYLLVEFADFAIPKTTAVIFERMLAGGLRPVVTHPERNALLVRRFPELEEWSRIGCLMQVTSSSLSGRFGREVRSASEEMMARGLVHVVASDAHDCEYRPPVLESARRQVAKDYGEDTAHALFLDNPAAIVAGAPLPLGVMPVKKKKWYQRL